MNKKRDIKFIIYQALYIFVICVVAIKGADINLDEVINKKYGWAYVDTVNNTVIQNEQYSKLTLFDPNTQIIVSIDEWNRKFPDISPSITSSGPYTTGPFTEPPKDNPPITPPQENKNTSPPVLGDLVFYQYHVNKVNNKNSYPIKVNGVTINPNTAGNIQLGGESSVQVTWDGGSPLIFGVKENKKPVINITRMTNMGEDAKVSRLQSTTCFRVSISDDFIEQIDVKFSGGITAKQAGLGVYDVTLNAFGSKSAFDNWAENKNSPYSFGFTVTVKDKIAPHSITGQQSFIFGEW